MSDHPIGLSIRGGIKIYPGTTALRSVDFDVRMGAVNVLVGENGAGKSTLMKVIAGVEPLTEGRIEMEGRLVHFRSPREAERHGIGIVFQELNLFPDLSVADNIFIAHERTRARIDIDRRSQRETVRALMRKLEHDIDPDMRAGDLSIGQQQIVEIARSLARGARILILDEPTSALSAAEVEVLFRIIAELKAQGVGIVYISHRLDELIRIGDYITVLRDGVITGSRPMEGVDLAWIVRSMIGDSSRDFPRGGPFRPGRELLRAEEICLPRPGGGWAVDHVSFCVHEGEILGIYGLMGAGRSELLGCLIGQYPHAGGRILLAGETLQGDVAKRIRKGLALIPEDRKNDGLIGTLAIRENLTLSSLRDFTRIWHLDLRAEIRAALDYVKRLAIKAASIENPVFSLSGGNQQKVVIGKALMTRPRVLLMDEPSRGIDIGAKGEVFRVMRQLAGQGLGIVFVTSDLDEVLSLSDRIIVMSDGRVAARFDAADADPASLAAAAAPLSSSLKDAA
ncbi:erythritol ABC transporter ATP-binding protein [Rubellimicrobium thermophilum DSM 16684]|uniref:Erythritol ABC transporter ATP-binding protein n=1 Tax=Rubellimicrobium thermophilum DSM 16684 TaxID=1123069 RepID=S9R6G3_9RHOB|nr:sugar ABC transporter ATP-binding protein [Rubellimicrobium thermophilum]EPX87487.1 erythritol ABC transporter ATP-binding protein [Rubellimicrobium thermophilum DSM 16684]